MTPEIQLALTPLPPVLLAAAFDTLARFPLDQRLEPAQLIAISRRIGCNEARPWRYWLAFVRLPSSCVIRIGRFG